MKNTFLDELARRMDTQRDYILICTCSSEKQAANLESVLNGSEFNIGVTAEKDKVYLHQAEAEAPYAYRIIKIIREYANSWKKLHDEVVKV